MDTSDDAVGVPNQITASGLRRAEAHIDQEEVVARSHGHIKTGGAVATDFPDEKEIRRETGVEKRFHDRVEHNAARKEHVAGLTEEHEHGNIKDRRPGYGHQRACPPRGAAWRVCVRERPLQQARHDDAR